MNYADIKANFASILNRRDLTPSQTQLFLQFAVQRIQRVLRVPAMEKLTVLVTDGTPRVSVPGDFLELISLTTNDAVNQNKFRRVDVQTAIRASNVAGIPTMFARVGPTFLIGNCPPSGTSISCYYYADANGLSADTDFNWLTDAAPDLLVYGALVRASDFFNDDRKAAFEQTFVQALSDLQAQSDQDELVGATISPAWSYDCQ